MSPGDAGVIPNGGRGGRVGSGGEATAHFRGGDSGAEGSGRNGRRKKKDPHGEREGAVDKAENRKIQLENAILGTEKLSSKARTGC